MRRIPQVLMIALALPLIAGDVRAQSPEPLAEVLKAAFEGMSGKLPAGLVAIVLHPKAQYASDAVEDFVSASERARRVASSTEVIQCSPRERGERVPCRFDGFTSVVTISGIRGEGLSRVVGFSVTRPVRTYWGAVTTGWSVTVEYRNNSWAPTKVELVWIS